MSSLEKALLVGDEGGVLAVAAAAVVVVVIVVVRAVEAVDCNGEDGGGEVPGVLRWVVFEAGGDGGALPNTNPAGLSGSSLSRIVTNPSPPSLQVVAPGPVGAIYDVD